MTRDIKQSSYSWIILMMNKRKLATLEFGCKEEEHMFRHQFLLAVSANNAKMKHPIPSADNSGPVF